MKGVDDHLRLIVLNVVMKSSMNLIVIYHLRIYSLPLSMTDRRSSITSDVMWMVARAILGKVFVLRLSHQLQMRGYTTSTETIA